MRLTRIAARVKRSPRSGFASGQKGQTLVEVLIAVAILGVVGVAFLTSLVVAYGAATLNDQKTTAESLSRAELERIRYSGYDAVVDNTTVKLGYDVIVDAEYIDPATYLPTGSPLGMKKVTVTVSRQGKVLLVTETIKVYR
jgi:prepilin-type N-terminal cleavage/methylation domain-containing protein